MAVDPAGDGITLNLWGQTNRPKQGTDESFAWHAEFPPETFVPPHIHPTQDEYVYVIDGELTLFGGGADRVARSGDIVRPPRGEPHGVFNRSGQTLLCWFWVTPKARLYDLFAAIDAMADQNPDDVVALSAQHEVQFLPPPS